MKPEPPPSYRWSHRLYFPDTLVAPLGFGTEYWRDRAELPGYELLVKDPRWQSQPEDPAHVLTSRLLEEVVDVANIIEYTVSHVEQYAGELNALVDAERIEFNPEVATSIGHPASWKLYVETQNLLAWVRALTDRVRRDWQGGQWGLLPAIRPDTALWAAVDRLNNEYVAAVAGARLLSNLTLHGANLPRQVLVGPNGIEVSYPDAPSRPIDTLRQLSYETQGDAVAESRRLRHCAITLVDGILDAFEAAAPERMRKPGF